MEFPVLAGIPLAAPGLMAGNAAVLNTHPCARVRIAIEQVFRKAGFPEQLFRTLLIGSKEVAR